MTPGVLSAPASAANILRPSAPPSPSHTHLRYRRPTIHTQRIRDDGAIDVNGALHEGCAANNQTILTLQNLTARAQRTGQRLIYQCHGTGTVHEIAAFLIGAGEYQYYGCGGWHQRAGSDWSDHRPVELDKPLGAPLAAGEYHAASGLWHRRFASGTQVSFNTRTNEGTITWGS